MKASQTFRKGKPFKSYEVQMARQQKSLHKYRNETLQDKKDDKVYMTKVQGSNKTSDNETNKRPFISMSSSNIPVISSFQKKIREAIQVRYQKSKINKFKYNNQLSFLKNQDPEELALKSQDKNLIQENSDNSEDMEDMKNFSYLRNELFVSIHQYHMSKLDQKKQSMILKESVRKRKFKIVNSKSIQAKEGFYSGHKKPIQKMSRNIEQQTNFSSPKQPKAMKVDLNVLKQSLVQNAKYDAEKRKSLTSRQKDERHQLIQFNNSDTAFDQVQEKKNLKHQFYIIKDTFKLKSLNKFNKNNDQKQYVQAQFNPNPLNYGNQKSGRYQNNKRRILLQTNQIKQNNIQREISQQSQKKIPLNYQSIPKTQNKKIFSSRKIQNQIIQQPHSIQKKTPAYKNTKEKIKTQQSFLNDFQSDQGQICHSSTQQKWKLQEISFRFKAINQQKTLFPAEKINNFIEQNEKALKIGFSLEKSYKKILSGRKIQRKQTPDFDNKRTIVSKNQPSFHMIEPIAYQTQKNREDRNISKNKRRKLRLKTQGDFEPDKPINQGISTVKNLSKKMQSPQNLTLIETQMKQSIKNSRDRQKREFLATNYRSKHKVDRFSTIS